MDHAQAIGADLILAPFQRKRALLPQVGLRFAFLLALTCSGLAQKNELVQNGSQLDGDIPSRGFAIPDTRAALALVDSVEGHIAARRWPEAINELQELIRDYDGDLLGAEYVVAGQSSQRPVHAGASEYARRRLIGLPREARDAYIRLYETDAQLLLAEALERSDRASLARVGTLYPLTHSALRAWCALGDLELEIGNTTEALLAWGRVLAQVFKDPEFSVRNRSDWEGAAKRLEDHKDEFATALRARVQLVLASYAGDSDGLVLADDEYLGPGYPDRYHSGSQRQLGREMRMPGPGEGVESLPENTPASWPKPFALSIDHPFSHASRSPLHAIRSGDFVLISDSLRVSAVNAYSGRLAWQSDHAPGWDEYYYKYDNEWTRKQQEEQNFFQGLDHRYSLIAPAATDSIVVAPLQIPVTHSSNAKYTSINITRIIPSRRLFAFDVETGDLLWKHMPAPGWDGEGGTFAERTRVCGPPVIAGGRVLVPSYRLQGRIDFHVACYDLGTGDLLWSTGLISGQRELNMFGRPEHAFSAPPVRVQGDRVVVLTQLGSVAALDLFSGSIIWETLYDQVGLRSAQMRARPNSTTWRNGPPVISGDVVIAAPVDSHDLIGLDLDTGAMLWSLGQSTIRHDRVTTPDLLIGADRNTIYLGGNKVMALSSPVDLRTMPSEKWSQRTETLRYTHAKPWPALARDSLLVPTDENYFRIDRLLGHAEPPVEWELSGNLLVTEGAFFTLNNRQLNGYFEWGTLIKRARSEYAANPSDLSAALGLSSLLADRGQARLQDSQADLARPFAEQAVDVLEPFLTHTDQEPSYRFSEQFHISLSTLARVQRYVGDPTALKTLRRARQFAVSEEALLGTLLEEHVLQHDTTSEEWFEVLATLEAECDGLDVECDAQPASADKASIEFDFIPRLPGPLGEREAQFQLPVALWVKLVRSNATLKAGDYEAAFEDLHDILLRFSSYELARGTAFELAEARIQRALRLGQGAGYERFEAQAQASLERALEADSPEALKLVGRFFPHSKASLHANDSLLASSIRSGDVFGVARILQSELPENWTPKTATKRDIEIVCSLANMLREQGNLAYFRGIVREFAQVMPETIVDAPGFVGQKLTDIEAALESEVTRAPASETATFDAKCSKKASFQDTWVFQGYVPGANPENEKLRQVAVFSAKDRLMALSSTDPSTPLWEYEFQVTLRRDLPPRAIAFSEGRVLLHDDEWLAGIDRETGEEIWAWDASSHGAISAVKCEDGVLLALLQSKGQGPLLLALDAHSGIELWSFRYTDPHLIPKLPLLGSGKMIFLPNISRKRVVVRDLFSSRLISEFSLLHSPARNAHEQIWIEDNLLIEPRMHEATRPDANHVVAYDLEKGEVVWRESFGDKGGRELTSITQFQGEHYLVLRERPGSKEQHLPEQIMRLHVGFGALQPIGNLQLSKRDSTINIGVRKTFPLEAPYIFLTSSSRDESRTLIRAVHLPHGERWVHTLPVSKADIYNRITPPALSDTTVALAYNEWPRDNTQAGVTRLRFIDRASGIVRDARDLSRTSFPRADGLRLVTLGSALILVGPSQMDVLE